MKNPILKFNTKDYRANSDLLNKQKHFAKQQKDIKKTFEEINKVRTITNNIIEILIQMSTIIDQQTNIKTNINPIKKIENYLCGLMGIDEYTGKGSIKDDLTLGFFYKETKKLLNSLKK